MFRRTVMGIGLAAAIMTGQTGAIYAQDFPNREILLVIAGAPGSSGDLLGRFLAKHLSLRLGQPVIVESKSGAGGTIAMEYVSKAEPDGHTLFLDFTGHAINPAVVPSLPYDSVNDFSYIGTVGENWMVLAVPKNSPAQNAQQLIDMAKEEPGSLMTGYLLGSATHMATEAFVADAGIDVLRVPYNSNNQANTDLLGERIDFAFSTIAAIQGQIDAGELRGLAVSSDQVSELLPNAPPLGQTLPGYKAIGWYGLLGPDGIAPERIAKLSEALNDFLKEPKSKAELRALGVEPWASSPQEFKAFVTSEIDRWKSVTSAASAAK